MKRPQLSIEEKVAQLFTLGSDTVDLDEELEPFYRYGLGGLLLFRHHLQPFSDAMGLRNFLAEKSRQFQGGGLTFTSIDQEGGQVERLPHWLFPTGVLPVALGLKDDPLLCQRINREMARRLRWLGFNLNFTPTLDLNREVRNPIIGVRAYGETPDKVVAMGRAVLEGYAESGVLPVAKHFPGHGSGHVDSHLALPIFESWQEDELAPYRRLMGTSLQGVLVAHGLYPRLFRELDGDQELPASISEAIVTRLLREQLGFQGLVFTDDLIMKAILDNSDPVEVALTALLAGVDVLVYRRAVPEALNVFENLVSRVQKGKFPEALLDAKVEKILSQRSQLNQYPVYDYREEHFSEEACHALALQWATECLVELHHHFISPLPLSHRSRWGLVAPDRQSMTHYRDDSYRGKGLLAYCQEYGITPTVHTFYPVGLENQVNLNMWGDTPLDVIVFVGFNSLLNPEQQYLYKQLKAMHPNAKMILASCGMPTDRHVLPDSWIHVQLPSYRPAAAHALTRWLITPPQHNSSERFGTVESSVE